MIPASADMSGRSLLYVLQRVVPFILFGVSGLICVSIEFQGTEDIFSDRVLFDLAVAEQVRSAFALGPAEGLPLAPTSHVLWQVLVGVMGILVPNLVKAGLLLNAAAALFVIWQSIRLAEKLLDHPAFVLSVGAVVAVSLPVQGGLVNHGPDLLGIALALSALRMHISGIVGDRPVLPIGSALLIGLAMLVHVEFVVLWIAMILHALLLSHTDRPRYTGVQAFLAGMVGLALFALVTWPVVHRNMAVAGMAWPFDHESPRLAASATGVVDLSPDTPSGVGEGVVGSYLRTVLSGGGAAAICLALTLAGIVLLALQFGSRERSRAFLLVGFLLVLVPLLYGLFSAGGGWMGSIAVLGSLYPMYVIAGLYAAFQAGLKLSTRAAGGMVIGAGGVWLALCLVGSVGHAMDMRKRTDEENAARKGWVDWQASPANVQGDGRLKVATDRPGWMCYRGGGTVRLDLTGWVQPDRLAACRNGSGEVDPAKLSRELGQLEEADRPQVMVLWDERREAFARRVMEEMDGRAMLASDEGARPTIVVLRWP